MATLAIAALIAELAACVVNVPVHETKVEEQVPHLTADIAVGQSDRASVRTRLGEPWVSSTYWGFDLFHVTGRSTSVPVMFVFWWPVPLGVAVDESTAYVLVTYDDAGRVTASMLDFARDPSIFGEFEDGTSNGGFASRARVDAGDLSFVTTQGEGDARLTIAAVRRDAFIAANSPRTDCRLLVGCTGGTCGFNLGLDGSTPIQPPEDLVGSALFPMGTKPGTHVLAIASTHALKNFKTSVDFTCQAGETWYAVVDTQLVVQNTLSSEWSATIAVTREMPETFRDLPLALWAQGHWLMVQEPGAQ